MAKKVAFYVLPTAIATFVLVAIVVLIAFGIFGCAGPISRGFEEHQQVGICCLVVENQTAYAAEIRSERFYEYGRDGLLPHTSGTLFVQQNRRYILILRMDANGAAWDERYEFFIPRGTIVHAITFGGLQTGVLYNQCDEPVKVFSPFNSGSFIIPPGESHTASAIPGNPQFVVYFGKEWESWVQVSFKINAICRDSSFNGTWVDWVGYIDPRVRNEASSR